MPVIAVQRPIQHHQTTRQTPVGDRALEAEGGGGIGEWGWQGRMGPGAIGPWWPVSGQLAHHHPGGRLHRLLAEKRLRLEPLTAGGAGFSPLLLRLPAKAKGHIRQRKGVAAIAAVDQQLQIQPDGSLAAAELEGLNSGAPPPDRRQGGRWPPAQPGFGPAPVTQNRLGRGGPVAEATHPVVIQPARLPPLQLAQKGPPEPGLPGAELVAIGAADPGGAHHSAEPGTGGEQQGVCPPPGGLQGCSHAARSPAPNHHINLLVGDRHGCRARAKCSPAWQGGVHGFHPHNPPLLRQRSRPLRQRVHHVGVRCDRSLSAIERGAGCVYHRLR